MRVAYVVLFLGYVVALPVTFVQVLGLLHDDLSYNSHLRLVMLLVAPVRALPHRRSRGWIGPRS